MYNVYNEMSECCNVTESFVINLCFRTKRKIWKKIIEEERMDDAWYHPWTLSFAVKKTSANNTKDKFIF